MGFEQNIAYTQEQITKIVRENIEAILAKGASKASIDMNLPLMNLGLSSLELLELRDRLSEALQESLHATFFFQYTSGKSIVDYFVNKKTNVYKDWLYNLEYTELSSPILPAIKNLGQGVWLIFKDEMGWSEELKKKLLSYNFSFVEVEMGSYYKVESPTKIIIRPDELGDYHELFKEEIFSQGIAGIIYLAALMKPLPPEPSLLTLQSIHKSSCTGLLNILKAITEIKISRMPKWYVVSWGLEKEGDSTALAQWPMTGLCKAIGAEHPDFQLRRIILDIHEPYQTQVDCFFTELFAKDNEDQIIWRQGKRLAPRLFRIELPEAKSPEFQSEATYIITGGLWGLGLEFLKWYVQRGARNIAILDQESVTPEAEGVIQNLRSQGVKIEIYSEISLSDMSAMQKIISEISVTLPPIKGVMHIAGKIDDDLVVNMDWSRIQPIFDIKISCAWILHLLTEKIPLDHFILFSSIGSAMGPLARGNRAAANAFLDALAHYRHAHKLPVLTINWGLWGHGGITVKRIFETHIPQGLQALKAEEGMNVLDRIMNLPIPEVVVAPINWREYLLRLPEDRPLFSYLATEVGLKKSEIIVQFRKAREEERLEIVKRYIRTLLRRILLLSPTARLDDEKTFLEYGLDESYFVELRNLIQFDAGSEISLPKDFVSENPSIQKLAEKLAAMIESLIPQDAALQEAIAIIGMDCRFPGARNYQEFWSNLVNRVDAIREVPADRWDWHKMKTKIHWGGFIEDIDKFDPLFFNISPKEAAYMDPQHRLFLESAWHAMEDAGYSSKMLFGKKVGVYAGVSKNDYAELMREQGQEIKAFISTGTVHSILSNRVSYILDIHGPSESIDTACSSALVALYSAVRDLRDGQATYAFVGGVNALLTPTMFESHTLSGMLASDGRCKTFDVSADGYSRGEGVGVILLKPLSEALKDGDSIYAVIRGVAVNHGGKSTGLTAPNINSQADVVASAIVNAKVDASTISYVEVHGTGTPLGDPIEIEGLKKGFISSSKRNLSEKSCALGAVKTNIGHCESAAGIAGLIKVALVLKNSAIPSNLHFHELNPKINLQNSPFYIAEQYQDWNPMDPDGKKLLRRAGLSSFGMGGANAHVILEQAPEISKEIKSQFEQQLFPISARKGQLQNYLTKYESYLEKILAEQQNLDLEALAYTMQTGRDEFEDRVVFLSNSIEDLLLKIKMFLKAEKSPEIFTGFVEKSDLTHVQTAKDSLLNTAESWVKGKLIDWSLYWLKRPHRLSGLPTYPFQALRCWFEVEAKEQPPAAIAIPNTVKGLKLNIEPNIFFLKDHIIAGQSILPGVMYLEMVRSVAEKLYPEKKIQRVGDVVWVAPIVAEDEALKIQIQFDDAEDICHFKVIENDILHCEGDLYCTSDAKQEPVVNISEIIQRLVHQQSQSEIYAKMKKQGLSQGKSLRVIQEFYSSEKEAVAKLILNSEQDLSEYKLHPCLMDGVFQTVVAHHFSEHVDGEQQYLPYGLKSLEWFRPFEREVYAYVEELPESSKGLLKYRMKMLSLKGEVIANYEGFIRRPLRQQEPVKIIKSQSLDELFYVEKWLGRKARDNRPLSNYLLLFANEVSLQEELSKKLRHVKIIRIGMSANFEKHSDEYYLINPKNLEDFKKLIDDLKERKIVAKDIVYSWDIFDATPILLLTQSLIAARNFQNLLLLYLYTPRENLIDAHYSMAAGFARTLIFENPSMELRSIELPPMTSEEQAEVILSEIRSNDTGAMLEVSYKNGYRQTREIISAYEIANIVPHDILFKVEGKYLISGGVGGLGRIFAEYLADRYHANLILLGRSQLNLKIQSVLDYLRKKAKSVHYLAVDVTDEKALHEAFQQLPKNLHNLNGVIHAAGIKKDSFILKKEESSFNQVIQVKVKGALSLDALTEHMSLDFMVLFSSIAALIPNQGQSDYAAANSFLDRFAKMRNHLQQKGERQGLTLSIAWPLWRSGGMQVTADQEKHLKTVFGMDPLPTEIGVHVFEHLLNYVYETRDRQDQIVVISGDKEKIMRAFQGGEKASEEFEWQASDKFIENIPENKIAPVIVKEEILKQESPEKNIVEQVKKPVYKSKKPDPDEIMEFLKECITVALNIAPGEINPDTDFERYGINSIAITEINTMLEKRYKNLPKTLFFEYSNLSELIKYFLNEGVNKEISSGARQSESTPETSFKPQQNIKAPLIDSLLEDPNQPGVLKLFHKNQAYVLGFSHKEKSAVPGACFLEMARQGASLLYPDKNFISIVNNYWPVPMEIEDEEIQAETRYFAKENDIDFEIRSSKGILHASGTLLTEHRLPKPHLENLEQKMLQAEKIVKTEEFYQTIHKNADLRLAGLFRPVEEFTVLENEAVARLHFPDESLFESEGFVIQPVIFTGLEQCLLVFTAITHAIFHPQGMRLMPVSIEVVDIYKEFSSRCILHIVAKKPAAAANKIQRFDASLYDENGELLAFISGNTMRISPLGLTENEIPESLSPESDQDIAIIGMSGRFPDANNLVEFWNNLLAGKDSINDNPMHQDLYHSDLMKIDADIIKCKYGSSISGIDEFAPEFFGIAPAYGKLIDPQERLFLQVAWEAMQDANWNPEINASEARKIGVFVGVIWQDYQLLALEESLKGDPVVASSLLYSIANRISYTFNFTGPSLSVDTACSSSLTALHLACLSILSGEIKSAIVGGVNFNLHPMKYAFLNNYSFLSSEGKCRSYGEGGSGYVPGEGVGAIVIKSLKEALKDGDPIYSVIKASSINHGGKTRGYTVPNPIQQSELILEAIKKAKINPREISYVEGHGTGTELGDPVEIRGLDLAYSRYTQDKQFCAIGSVKSNIGHLEAAAGIASIIKVILQMEHQTLVPSLHAEILNKNIDFSDSPFYVNRTVKPWKSETPYLAAVSSFGAGGSYAHVILQKYGTRRDIRVPTTSQINKKYWIEQKSVQIHPLLGEKYLDSNNEIYFLNELNLSTLNYLQDHKVFKYVIYPGVGYLEMLLAAGRYGAKQEQISLVNVDFEKALSLEKENVTKSKVTMTSVQNGFEVLIYTKKEDDLWQMHAKGTVLTQPNGKKLPSLNIEEIQSRCSTVLTKKELYQYSESYGMNLGENFQTLNKVYLAETEALAEIKTLFPTKEYLGFPGLFDSAMQMLAMFPWNKKISSLYLPVSCEAVQLFAPLEEGFVYCQVTEITDTVKSGNLTFCNLSGEILLKLTGVHFRKTSEDALKQMLAHEKVIADFFYEWDWQEKELNDVHVPSPLGRWLIFSDSEVSQFIIKSFEEKGGICKNISLKDHPKTKEEFVTLLQQESFSGILHCSSINNPESLSVENIEHACAQGVKSVLHLTQALVELQEKIKIPVFLITRNIISSNVPASPLVGFYKTLIAEQPQLEIKLIDLEANYDAAMIERAIFSRETENFVVLRNSKFYVPRFMKIKHIPLEEEGSIMIRPDSTYLITGSLGGLGLTLAKTLLEKGAGHLVLTGRKALDDEMKATIKNLQSDKITYEVMDVGDETSVKDLLRSLEKSEKPLKGIFHLAGVLDDATLMEQDWNHFEKVFSAKVYGSFYLHRYSKNLDLFVMFSSIASSLGNPGQSNYAAANAFMDALCEYRKKQGLPAHSLSWGPWAEVGMAKELVSRHARAGLLGLKTKEAIHALVVALLCSQAHITIANIDWKNYLEQMIDAPSWLEAYIPEKISKDNLLAQLALASESERLTLLKSFLIGSIRSVLGFSESQVIEDEKGFFDMGLDSLMMIELKNKIQLALGKTVILPGTLIFDYPTLKSISEHLMELLGLALKEESLVSQTHSELLEKESEKQLEKMSDEEVLKKLFEEGGMNE